MRLLRWFRREPRTVTNLKGRAVPLERVMAVAGRTRVERVRREWRSA